MTFRLEKELDHLKEMVLSICTLVEENVTRAVSSLQNQSEEKAQEVIMFDKEIDKLEIEIEEECLKLLALHQPVASDLRFIVAVLKINNDLERIGDLAEHISERFLSLEFHYIDGYFRELFGCAEKVRKMLRMCLDAFVEQDMKKAKDVTKQDDEIDTFHEAFFEEMKQAIVKEPASVNIWFNLLFISKQLERIGDHINNIAQDVVYLIEGDIVRHPKLRK